MIIGNLNNNKFTIDNGDILCFDIKTKHILRNMYDSIMVGFKTYYGNPDYYLAEKLKEIGAKNVKYINEDETKNLIY